MADPFASPLAQAGVDTSPLIFFGIYLLGVFALAWLSNRVGRGRSFVGEYFLGSRSFGMWAFALTFAATAASGGSFMGFPSKIYTHGWVLALWIASYMVVPLVALGLLGKRLNQIARRTRAVTLPEVLHERFRSPWVGACATLIVTFFMFFYLLAQFKGGSKILTTLLDDLPAFQASTAWVRESIVGFAPLADVPPDYLLSLLAFGAVVIVYVVYGGFRAIVWTDVMQGFVMFGGVVVLLVLVLSQTGGLENATRWLSRMQPPEFCRGHVEMEQPASEDRVFPAGTWFDDVKLTEVCVVPRGERASQAVELLRLVDGSRDAVEDAPPPGARVSVDPVSVETYAYGAGQSGVYVSAPGPEREDSLGYLSLTMALSFFVFWAFGAAGQPSNMVRLMAVKDTVAFRRSMATVAVYYSVIYGALVVIFCCGRVLLPGMEDDSDRIMPELARHVTETAGVPWLSGLLLAAPFAAVMSSVDSFLLMVSSSVVRDVYQRGINPRASERRLRILSYCVTALVGVAAMVAVIWPPRHLQDLIIFSTGGLAGCFLTPVALALYWKRCTAPGMIAGMLGGCATHTLLSLIGYWQTGTFRAYEPFGFAPLVWDILGSTLLAITVSLATAPVDEEVQRRFF